MESMTMDYQIISNLEIWKPSIGDYVSIKNNTDYCPYIVTDVMKQENNIITHAVIKSFDPVTKQLKYDDEVGSIIILKKGSNIDWVMGNEILTSIKNRIEICPGFLYSYLDPISKYMLNTK